MTVFGWRDIIQRSPWLRDLNDLDTVLMNRTTGRPGLIIEMASLGQNVHAVGIGEKQVNGRRTGEFSLRVYVTHKLPDSLVPEDRRLPREVEGIPVDVIESQMARFAAPEPTCSVNRRNRQRPIRGGISGGHSNITAGTISCLCRSTRVGDPDGIYVLSNNHVFANLNNASLNDPLIQPGVIDGGTLADRFATLHRWVTLNSGQDSTNRVDAAIGLLDDGVRSAQAVCRVGTISGIVNPSENLRVRLSGRTTAYTAGEIVDVSVDQLVGGMFFEDQIRIEPRGLHRSFGESGDSGAMVMQQGTRDAVGLFFASPDNGSFGLANPMATVLQELEILI
jgi:hypothetical protein